MRFAMPGVDAQRKPGHDGKAGKIQRYDVSWTPEPLDEAYIVIVSRTNAPR
jgi:hypothetical protein